MPDGPPRRRRARPVADAPVDALVLRVEDLTKGWLLALLEESPLDDAPSILARDLARDGPRVCDAVVRALSSDDDLRRIDEGGPLEPLVSQTAVYAGTEGADAVSRAAAALGGVIWSAIREELSYPDADQISELAERLARVIEVVRRAALRRSGQGERRVMEPAEPVEPVEHRRIAWPPPAPTSPTGPSSSQAPGAPPAPVAAAGAPLWQGALAEEVIRAERTGTPLSLLLVELEDAERLTAAEPAHEAAATFGRFAQAVRSVARRQDILACESEARAWVIARDTTRSGARTLGERIVGAVREAHPWRGAPLTVNLGLAVYGEDGRGAAALIESAEQAMFAAAASGNDVADPAGDD